jgi:DNA polymerase III subunit epsilon
MLESIHEFLPIDKPLVVFDIETTGLSLSADRIVELAYFKFYPNGPVKEGNFLINPEIEISPEAAEVHGITNARVAEMPAFSGRAQEIWDIFSGCFFGGFNIMNFDLPILRREFIRVGMDFNYSNGQIIDSKAIQNYMEPRTLAIAYKQYCRKEKTGLSDAKEDAKAAAEILASQLEKYREIRELDFIRKIHSARDSEYTDNTRKFYWKSGEAHFAFSKYEGEPLNKVAKRDPGFMQWILEAEFSEYVKSVVFKALERIKRKK